MHLFHLALPELHPHAKQSESRQSLHPSKKMSSKWIIDLDVKCNNIKLLENNNGENLGYFGFIDDFLDREH